MLVFGPNYGAYAALKSFLNAKDKRHSFSIVLLSDHTPADKKLGRKWCREMHVPFRWHRAEWGAASVLIANRKRDTEMLDVGKPDHVYTFMGVSAHAGKRFWEVLDMIRWRNIPMTHFHANAGRGGKLAGPKELTDEQFRARYEPIE